jgi:hypothetical protein
VRDETGRSCGTLKVAVKWRKPLRPGGRQLGPNALTATETELLISRFSKQKDGQVKAQFWSSVLDTSTSRETELIDTGCFRPFEVFVPCGWQCCCSTLLMSCCDTHCLGIVDIWQFVRAATCCTQL